MKKTLLSILALGMSMFGVNAATEYSVADYVAACANGALGSEVTVTGYIVGWVDGASIDTGAKFELPANSYSNILLGGSTSEKDLAYIVPVQLVSQTDVRAALNLKDHPENFHYLVSITGNSEKYFGKNAAIKTPTAYAWVGDAPVATETPGGGSTLATGSKEAPLSVTEFLAQGTPDSAVANTYVKGYIVGNATGMNLNDGIVFGTEGVTATNILVAASSDVKDVAACIPVQLPAGDIRSALNLMDNPGNLGKLVTLCGSHEKYFGANGLKSVTWYDLAGSQGGSTTTPGADDDAIYAGLSQNGDDWTIEGEIPEGLNYVWAWDATYGMKASAFYQKAYAAEATIVSPIIDLAGYTEAKVTLSQAGNFFKGNYGTQAISKIREENGAWEVLAYSPVPETDSWTFVNSEAAIPAALQGKKIQLSFTYISTETVAPTWEIKNLKVVGTSTTGVENVEVSEGVAEYYTLQGVKVANPEKGIYVKVQNGKAVKVLVK